MPPRVPHPSLRSKTPTLAWTAALLGLVCVSGCLTPEGYYRNRPDAGMTGEGSGGSSGLPGTGGTVVTGSGGAIVVSGTGGSGAGGHTGVGGATVTPGAGGTTGPTGPGGMSGSVLLTDDFESGIGKWTPNDYPTPGTIGTATIKMDGSNVCDLDTPMSKVYFVGAGVATGPNAWTDVIIQARVKIISFAGSSSSYYAGVCARVQKDGVGYYCAALRSDGKLAVRAQIGGNGTTLGSSVSAGIATGTWYTLKLEVVGSAISVFLNGTMMDSTTDSSIPAGGVALVIDNGEAEFDDVSVTVP